MDATEEQFAELSAGIREMAKVLPASAVEIAGVAESAGQLGIANEHILSFTRTMIDLGEATNLTAEQAATEFARFANIVGMSQKDFDRLGSTVVALGNNLATTEREIVEMAMRLAGAGAQIGLTEAEIMSFAAALSSVGIEAEAGGSSFSKVMVEMQLAAELGGDKLKAFADVAGMSVNDFKKAFEQDAAGAIIAFIKGLSTAEERGVSAIKVLDDMGIKEVRMRDALLRAAGASDVFTDAIELGSKAWEENIALTNEAEQRYATSESQIKILWNRLKDVAITLGDSLVPAVIDALDAAEPLIRKIEDGARAFSEMDEEQQRLILKLLAFTAAIGPVSVGIGQVSSGIGGLLKVGGQLSNVLGIASATGGAGLLGRFAMMGPGALTPVGLAVAGVGAVGLALYNLHKNSEQTIEDILKHTQARREEIDTLDETINAYEKLQEKNKLSSDEVLRYMDIMTELKNAKTEEGIKALTKEQEALLEKSGFTNDEMEEFLRLNSKIVEETPEATQKVSEYGNAYAELTDEVRKLNETERERLRDEIYLNLIGELQSQLDIIKEQEELQRKLADEKANRIKLIEEIRDKQEEVLTLTGEEREVNEIVLEDMRSRLGLTDKTIDKLNKKIELNDKELEQYNQLLGEYEAIVLSEVNLTAEKGKGNEAIMQRHKEIAQTIQKLEEEYQAGKLTTEEFNKQNDELREEQRNLSEAKSRLDTINREIDIATGKYKNQGLQIDNNNKKTDAGIKKEQERTKEAGKDVDKKVTVDDKGTAQKVHREAEKPATKRVTLSALWTDVQTGLTNALRAIRFPGFASGTNHASAGLAWLGEEGTELVKYRDKWALADFGLYNLRGGEQVFTHDQSMRILRALNNLPGYASGTNMGGETNRIVSQLNDRDRTIINNENNIVINATIRDDSDIDKLITKLDEKLSELGNRRQAAWGGA